MPRRRPVRRRPVRPARKGPIMPPRAYVGPPPAAVIRPRRKHKRRRAVAIRALKLQAKRGNKRAQAALSNILGD